MKTKNTKEQNAAGRMQRRKEKRVKDRIKKRIKIAKEAPPPSSDPRRLLLSLIVVNAGGTTKATAKIKKLLKDPKFSTFSLNNWRHRCGVPLRHVRTLAKFFDVPAEALNYRAIARITGRTWAAVVNECKFLSPEEKKGLLELNGPKCPWRWMDE